MSAHPLSNLFPFVAALLAIAPPSFAGVTSFTDPASFQASQTSWMLESFEAVVPETGLTELDFSGMAFSIVSLGVNENRVVDTQDGYGAIANDGSNFWKLAGGSTTVDFGGNIYEAIGFYYSDLERADVQITLHGDTDQQFLLSDNNANQNHFIGLSSDDGGFDSFTLSWIGSQTDGIGIDGLMLGRSVPEPGTLVLAMSGLLLVNRRKN